MIPTVHHREVVTLPEVGAKVTVELDEDRRWDLVSWYCYLRVIPTLLRCQLIQRSGWSLHYLRRKEHQQSYRASKYSLLTASPQTTHIMDLPVIGVAKFSHRDNNLG